MPESIATQPAGVFLDALASGSPAPGGGSAAAFGGAMAAGLVSMVCHMTLGKQQYAEHDEEVRGILDRAEALRHSLQALADEEVAVFGRLSAAYRLPRTTDADAATRQAAIQRVTRQAAEAPLHTAQAAAGLLPLCTALASRCSRLIVSNVGVAAVLARAAVQSAILSAEINLAALDDQLYAREVRAQVEDLVIGLNEETDGIVAIVRGRING